VNKFLSNERREARNYLPVGYSSWYLSAGSKM